MLRTVVIDAEEHPRKILSKLLQKNCPDVEILALCSTTAEAEEAIYKHRPNLIFLDVEMPVATGLDLIMHLKESSFEIIFTTVFEKYAIQAMRFSALDFLVKPFVSDDVLMSVRRIDYKITRQQQREQIGALLHNMNYLNADKKITLPTLTGLEFVALGNIIRCESDNTYTIFYLADKTRIVVSKSIGEYEAMLTDYHFFRIHQSHLINLRYVRSYKRGNGGTITMEDNSVVDVSRRRKEQLISRLSLI